MNIHFKNRDFVEKKLVKANGVLSIIALIGFFFNITIIDFYNIVSSTLFWLTTPKTFLITMPFMELFFVSISGRKEAKKKFFKVFPYTIFIIFIIWLILKLFFSIGLYELIVTEWWVGLNNYKSILLGYIVLLFLGFINIEILNTTFSFYFLENKSKYAIGGFIVGRANNIAALGAPSIIFIKSYPIKN